MPALKDLKLKICGLRDNIDQVAALSPDYVGFIFYPKSPRYVGHAFSPDQVKEIPAHIAKVGVFVNEAVAEIKRLVKAFGLNYVQLHGDESVEDCEELKTAGIGVIKVFAGNGTWSEKDLDVYGQHIDYYLFDTRLQHYGGSGVKFEWDGLFNLNLKKPIFLSGGLDLTNIREIEYIEKLEIHAIDVNSRFELNPGLKNIELIEKLNLEMQRS